MRNIVLPIVIFSALVIFAGQTTQAQLLSLGGLRKQIGPARRLTNRGVMKPSILGTPAGAWYPYVIVRPEERQRIRQMPIEVRPNRPLHFWGNSRRRRR